MQNRFTQLILALITTLALFTSCKKEYSADEPLPDVYDPSLLIGSQNGFLYALDPSTGDKKWEYNAAANIQGSPLVMKDYVYVPSEDGFIHKLDAKTGKLVIKYTTPKGQVITTPTGENGFVYFGSSNDTMYCWDAVADTIEWKHKVGGAIYSSALLYDTLVVFGCNDGKVYALDKEDGLQVWAFNPGTASGFTSSPAFLDSFIYIGGTDGRMYELKVFNGTQVWAYATGGPILSSPAIFGGNCIFGSNDGKIYCVDIISGQTRWNPIDLKDRLVSSPYPYNQTIYIGSYDHNMYAIDIIDGYIKWSKTTEGIVKSSPMVYKNKLYFGSHDKFLYALDPETGDQYWKQNINGLIECSPVVDNRDGSSTYTSTVSGNSPY